MIKSYNRPMDTVHYQDRSQTEVQGHIAGEHIPAYQSTVFPRQKKVTSTICNRTVTKGAIIEVPPHQRGGSFIPPYFKKKKETGDLRPVLDLGRLNKKIKMEGGKPSHPDSSRLPGVPLVLY